MPTGAREIRLTLPRPHAGQRTVLDGVKRFNVVACGRRWGKTCLGVHRLIAPALDRKPVAYFAPTYRMLAEVWRETRNTLQPVAAAVNVQQHRIELITGGSVEMWSLDSPDSARGRKYARAVIDEAAMVPGLEDAWNNVIRPTLTDYRGDADFLSTPRGLNFFWRLHCRGNDPHEPEWASWRMPTVANPFIDPDEVEAARRQLPERSFAQEYLAEFIEESGGVFRCVSEAVDAGRTSPDEPDPLRRYTLGVDLARVEDFTVLCVLDSAGRQAYVERFNQISWERQISAIRAAAERYKADVVIDSTGVGDPIADRLADAGLSVTPYHLTNASKAAVIDTLAMALERGRLRLMDVPEQTGELLAYQYELTPARTVRTNAPPGMHDDTVIALALAAWGIESGPSLSMVPNPIAGYRG